MRRRGWIGSVVLLAAVAGVAVGLTAWKRATLSAQAAEAAHPMEPVESVTAAVAHERPFVRTTTSIGTVKALRSITLKNEIAGTVREVALEPGQVVDENALLVALDVSVEEAELAAQNARAALAQTVLERTQRASEHRGASEVEVDRARAELDITGAEMARIKAVIARKTIRAPFRARVGMADIHVGQYLNEGTEITTLQGVADLVHVDFAVSQEVAAHLAEGGTVGVFATSAATPAEATIVAIDARVDPSTRNAWVRAQVAADRAPAPGASVRVRVPVGETRNVVVVPVSARRKGPGGDHVFAIERDAQGAERVHLRNVISGAVLGDEVVIESGVTLGERVAASGSFKLREGARVAIVEDGTPNASAGSSAAQSTGGH
jgi:membrane fusion protein (multidrug efflux system)